MIFFTKSGKKLLEGLIGFLFLNCFLFPFGKFLIIFPGFSKFFDLLFGIIINL